MGGNASESRLKLFSRRWSRPRSGWNAGERLPSPSAGDARLGASDQPQGMLIGVARLDLECRAAEHLGSGMAARDFGGLDCLRPRRLRIRSHPAPEGDLGNHGTA